MGIKDNLKLSVNLSKKFLKRSLAATLIFSLLFNVNANLKVYAGAKVEHMPLEQLPQWPLGKVQEIKVALDKRLEEQEKCTPGYTQTIQDLAAVLQELIYRKNVETTELDAQIKEQQSKMDALEEEIRVQSDKVMQAVAALYVACGGAENMDLAFVDLLLKTDGMKDFVDMAETVTAINDNYTEILQRLESEKDELYKQRQVFEAKKQELSEASQNLEDQKKKFEKLMQENAEAIKQIQRERISAAGGSGQVTSRVIENGGYMWPVQGHWTITGFFGEDRGTHTHSGIDINDRTIKGAPVVAAAAGKVKFAGCIEGYGLCVQIDHGGGYSTLYAHLCGIEVKSGEIGQGCPIGYVGSTGWSEVPHLHFEVRINNTPVNPLDHF